MVRHARMLAAMIHAGMHAEKRAGMQTEMHVKRRDEKHAKTC